jgi:small subunit ribosomal protein S6
MSHYELTYIISAAIAETEYPSIQQKINDLIKTTFGGTITSEVSLGRKKLAYPINKEKYGHYITLELDLEPAQLKQLDTDLKLNTSLLRHLIVSKQLLTPEQVEKEAATQMKIRAKKANAKAAISSAADKRAAEASAPVVPAAPKITLDKLDEKLDEILDQEIK